MHTYLQSYYNKLFGDSKKNIGQTTKTQGLLFYSDFWVPFREICLEIRYACRLLCFHVLPLDTFFVFTVPGNDGEFEYFCKILKCEELQLVVLSLPNLANFVISFRRRLQNSSSLPICSIHTV